MRLLGTKTSPYVRKVRIAAAELGLDGKLVYEQISFAEPPPEFAGNPLRRVPTLITDDGTALFDSPVIAEWLDAEHGGHRLLPAEGARRWTIKRTEALADGLLDSATAARQERQRDAAMQSPALIDKHVGKVRNALDHLDRDESWRSNPTIDLGQIAVAAAIGYLDLRLPELLDRAAYPRLLAWYDEFAKRPSMVSTAPA